MKTILLTGATGNISQAVLRHFSPGSKQQLFLAYRKEDEKNAPLLYRFFDFTQLNKSKETLAQTDILFLLRPPHISDVQTYFAPLLQACVEVGVKHVMFLSVQGADTASFIPHAKIEKLILKSGIAYTFIRPSYFMQNLTTTLRQDIREKNKIFLPAGEAPFLWVDVDDIGKAIARVLEEPEKHRNRIYTITGEELLDFGEVADMLSALVGRPIHYRSPNLLRFFFGKKREGVPTPFILVMMLLHFLPRFQPSPAISPDFTVLTGEQPNSHTSFMHQHREEWL